MGECVVSACEVGCLQGHQTTCPHVHGFFFLFFFFLVSIVMRLGGGGDEINDPVGSSFRVKLFIDGCFR